MRKVSILAGICSLLMMGSTAFGQQQLVSVHAHIDHVYAPDGFDDNDQTEVVVAGHLPDLCYKAPSATFEVTADTIEVTVKTLRVINPLEMCPPLEVPFLETVSIGNIKAGQYEIVVNRGTAQEKRAGIKVNQAQIGAQDDYIYAGVNAVTYEPGSRTIDLDGYNPSDCLELDRIEIKNNGIDTYAILPIMKRVVDACPMKLVPFKYSLDLPEDIETDDRSVLLHVRSMEGKSVNTLFIEFE